MGIALTLIEAERIHIAENLFKVTSRDACKGELHGLCPVHQENNPSFSYNYKKDTCHCFACGFDGDLCALWSAVHRYDKESGFKAFCLKYHIDLGSRHPTENPGGSPVDDDDSDDLPGNLEEVWEKLPPLPDEWISRLERDRGWSRKWIEILDLRLQTHYQDKKSGQLQQVRGNPERIAIPVRDTEGKLRNIRLYRPGGGAMKIISWSKQYGSARLYPAQPLLDADPILLCEGEPDTNCALSHGFNGITQTSKLKKWKSDHLKPFKGRDVVIAYDADRAGQKYATSAAQNIITVARSVRLLEWPDFMKENGEYPKDHGQDLTDFFVRHQMTADELRMLIASARRYDPNEDFGPLRFFERGVNDRISFKPRLLAEKILEDYRLMYDPKTGQLYRWNGKTWNVFDEGHIRQAVIHYLGNEAQKSRIEDVLYQVKALATLPHGRAVDDRIDFVNIENGILNLYTLEVIPHDHEYFFSHILPVTFYPDKSENCDRWMQFLDETVQTPDAIALLQEWTGYCLIRSNKFEKALHSIGKGGAGQSTYYKILRLLVGPKNCASVAFADLEDQFHRSSLYGKLVNISTEIGSKAIDTPYYKAITSGDPVNAAFKHRDVFEFVPYCKLCFSGNRLPRVLDNSDGFFRRVLLVEFKKQFIEGVDADPDLFEKLKSELSGIFQWALLGLHRLLKQNHFTASSEMQQLLFDYRRSNNPVLCFIEDRCVIAKGQEIEKAYLYSSYRKYCNDGGFTALNSENFFRELYVAVGNLKFHRPKLGGKSQPRVVEGISVDVSAE